VDTEHCILGTENKTRIINLERVVVEIKDAVQRLTNHYSNRPTNTLLRAVSVLCGLLGVSVGVNATLIVLIVKMVS
jgi:hypothetical protein